MDFGWVLKFGSFKGIIVVVFMVEVGFLVLFMGFRFRDFKWFGS